MWSREILITFNNSSKVFCQNSFRNASARSGCKHAVTSINKVDLSDNHHNEIFPYKSIPKPKGLPIVGTLFDFIAAGSAPKLHEYIDQRHQKFGPIFLDKIGPTTAVFISTPEIMRSVFFYEGKYPKHPLPDSWILYNQINECKRGLFFMDGEEWMKHRKILNNLLLKSDCNWAKQPIIRSTDKFFEKWKYNTNDTKAFWEIPDLEADLYHWSIDVIMSVCLGSAYNNEHSTELEDLLQKFANTVHTVFNHTAKLTLTPPILAKILKLKSWTDFDHSVTETLNLANEIMKILINKKDKGDGLLAKLLATNIPLEMVQRIFADLIIAAGDTTVSSTQWSLYYLALNKDLQKNTCKLINENNNNMESDIVRSILRESLRMHPVAPFIGRYLFSDAILGNYKIPKDTLVILSLYSSGRDNDNFPNAHQFLPQRWTRDSTKAFKNVNKSHGSIPFAMGSRSCVGRKIALLQIHTFLTKILQKYDLTSLNKNKVNMILKLIASPSEKIQIGIRLKQQ